MLLDADEPVLRTRISQSEQGPSDWRLEHLADYSVARQWLRQDADLVVETGHRTADQVAAVIAERVLKLRTRVGGPGTRVGGLGTPVGGL